MNCPLCRYIFFVIYRYVIFGYYLLRYCPACRRCGNIVAINLSIIYPRFVKLSNNRCFNTSLFALKYIVLVVMPSAANFIPWWFCLHAQPAQMMVNIISSCNCIVFIFLKNFLSAKGKFLLFSTLHLILAIHKWRLFRKPPQNLVQCRRICAHTDSIKFVQTLILLSLNVKND